MQKESQINTKLANAYDTNSQWINIKQQDIKQTTSKISLTP